MRRRLLSRVIIFSFVIPTAAIGQTAHSAQVAQGLAALEQFRTTGDEEQAAAAARAFSLAIRADRNDAWAHYGLGVILFRAKKTMAIARRLGVVDGEAIFVARRELERALDLKPDFTEAAEALALVAERTEDAQSLARARTVLTRSAGSGEAIGRADLALNDSTAVLAREAVSAMDHLRRAMVLFGRRADVEGGAAYLAGVGVWDDASARTYANDLEIIASPQEKIALTSGSLAQRTAALHMFWKKRAVRDGVSIGARVGTHYRRLAIARRDYKRAKRRGAPGAGAIVRSHETGVASEIDDRGVIYVRYGEPLHRNPVQNALTRANDTWVYRNPDGSLEHFRFAALEASSGFQLVADPVAMLDIGYDDFRTSPRGWLKLSSDQYIANAQHFFDEQGRYDPKWRLMSSKLNQIRSRLAAVRANPNNPNLEAMLEGVIADIRIDNLTWSKQGEARTRAALHRDLAAPRFDRPLNVFHDFATFRGTGCTDVVYTLAAPGPSYRVNVNLADTLSWETQRVDTLVSLAAGASSYVRSTGTLCAQPNPDAYVRFTVSASDSVGSTAGGSIAVPDYSGNALMMSDLLFATAQEGPFERGAARLALVPPRQFRQNQPFRIFYELYNLTAGARYTTEITFTTEEGNPFARLFKGKKTTSIKFDGDAATATLQELRTLVPEVEPGRVTVAVTVTTNAASTTKSETIWILPSDE